MRWAGLIVVAFLGPGTAAAAEPPTIYTNADLERMFGPAAAAEPAPPRTSADADWGLVESVLGREQARLAAEKALEIERLRVTTPPKPDPAFVYPVVWRLGFPASSWWKKVWCEHTGRQGAPGIPGLLHPCPSPVRGWDQAER